jgi:hypothetical protein
MWEPLGAPGGSIAPGGNVIPNFTPPHPSYISGHSTFAGAAFTVLTNFYGTDAITFTLESDQLPGTTRSYHGFSAAAAEAGLSRIYLGIHWGFDNTFGQITGREVGDFVFRTQLAPVPEPSAWLLIGTGLTVLVMVKKRLGSWRLPRTGL